MHELCWLLGGCDTAADGPNKEQFPENIDGGVCLTLSVPSAILFYPDQNNSLDY
jgi:hypothetical protein